MQEDIFSDTQIRAPKIKQTSIKAIIFNFLGFVFISYVTKERVQCRPDLGEWFNMMRGFFFVNFCCGVISRIRLGSFARNVEKVVKILSIVVGYGYMIFGAYLTFYDETCQKEWPLGFYTVMIFGLFSILMIIIFFVALCCLVGTAYFSKDKSD